MKKSKKHVVGKIDGGIYPFDCFVFIGSSKEQVEKKILSYNCSEYKKHVVQNLEYNGGGKTVQFDDNTHMLWVMSDYLPLIAHEISHLAFFIISKSGQRVTEDNDEGFAYLVEYLWIQLLPLLNKYKELNK